MITLTILGKINYIVVAIHGLHNYISNFPNLRITT